MASDPGDARRPEEVHPEFDMPTQGNIGEWSDEQIERYNELKDRDLETEAQASRAELSTEQRETLAALEGAVTDDGEATPTVTVDLGEADVEVRTKLTGEIEDCFSRIASERDADVPDLSNIKDDLLTAIAGDPDRGIGGLIVDDGEPDDDPHRFTDRETWEVFYAEHGTEGLLEVFDLVADPALARMEELGNSRGRGSERR